MQENIKNPSHYIRLSFGQQHTLLLSGFYIKQSSKDTREETYELAGIALSNVQYKQDTLHCCLVCLVCTFITKHCKLKLQCFVVNVWSHTNEFQECCTGYHGSAS